MSFHLRAAVCVFAACGLPGLSATAAAMPQEPAGTPAVSLERIRGELGKGPALRLKLEGQAPAPVPLFRSGVDQRRFVLTLEEALHKQFDLTPGDYVLSVPEHPEWQSRITVTSH